MLRITAGDTATKITLELEGDLVGVWVSELFEAWTAARRALNGRTLSIDLSAVGHVDKAGEYLLALFRCNGAQLAGTGLVTGNLIRTISQDWPLFGSQTNREA